MSELNRNTEVELKLTLGEVAWLYKELRGRMLATVTGLDSPQPDGEGVWRKLNGMLERLQSKKEA